MFNHVTGGHAKSQTTDCADCAGLPAVKYGDTLTISES